MTNTTPHFLYSDVVNSVKGTKAFITALSGVLPETLAYATDTKELGVYDSLTTAWVWFGASGTSSGGGRTYDMVFQTMGA